MAHIGKGPQGEMKASLLIQQQGANRNPCFLPTGVVTVGLGRVFLDMDPEEARAPLIGMQPMPHSDEAAPKVLYFYFVNVLLVRPLSDIASSRPSSMCASGFAACNRGRGNSATSSARSSKCGADRYALGRNGAEFFRLGRRHFYGEP